MANLYRNAYIKKPKTAIWSDGSNASVILNNEFFGTAPVAYELTIDSGVYVITGSNIDLLYNRVLDFESGVYSITGSDIDFSREYILSIDPGNYSYTGTEIEFLRDYVLPFDSGSYLLAGTNFELLRGYLFDFEPGTYNLTGTDIDFEYVTPPILSADKTISLTFSSNFVLR